MQSPFNRGKVLLASETQPGIHIYENLYGGKAISNCFSAISIYCSVLSVVNIFLSLDLSQGFYPLFALFS
jgi:hypothetical protein